MPEHGGVAGTIERTQCQRRLGVQEGNQKERIEKYICEDAVWSKKAEKAEKVQMVNENKNGQVYARK